jgi:ABC-type polysaccharide/polyol phosphate export permease
MQYMQPNKSRLDSKTLDTRRYSARDTGQLALHDLTAGLRSAPIWWGLGLHDVRQRFRRSLGGPLWITLNMAITIAAIGFVFGQLFGTPADEYLPYLATGILVWTLISGVANESCSSFIDAHQFIRNLPMPLFTHVLRTVTRNFLIFGMNFLACLGVLVLFAVTPTLATLDVVPGIALVLVNLLWVGLALALVSVRYRDVIPIVANVCQIIFFITPIFWHKDRLLSHTAFIEWNPVYHLIEVIRAPLLGQAAGADSYLIVSLLAICGTLFIIVIYRRTFTSIAFWV